MHAPSENAHSLALSRAVTEGRLAIGLPSDGGRDTNEERRQKAGGEVAIRGWLGI